jgi:hypothetical protein
MLGKRSLAIHYQYLAYGRQARVMTPTFIPPEDINMPGYGLEASPTLYPGQIVHAGLMADAGNRDAVACRLTIQAYGENDRPMMIYSPYKQFEPGESAQIEWQAENTGGAPIFRVGLEIGAIQKRADGTIYLDFLTWDGEPLVTFRRPESGGTMWRRAWVKGVDSYEPYWPEAFRIIQNEGTGLLIQGARDWTNYTVSSTIKPHVFKAGGIAARVQGMRRYYALLLSDAGTARLVKVLDGEDTLAECEYRWQPEAEYAMQIDVMGTHLTGRINGQILFDVEDTGQPLTGGGIALVCIEGRMATESVSVSPV